MCCSAFAQFEREVTAERKDRHRWVSVLHSQWTAPPAWRLVLHVVILPPGIDQTLPHGLEIGIEGRSIPSILVSPFPCEVLRSQPSVLLHMARMGPRRIHVLVVQVDHLVPLRKHGAAFEVRPVPTWTKAHATELIGSEYLELAHIFPRRPHRAVTPQEAAPVGQSSDNIW